MNIDNEGEIGWSGGGGGGGSSFIKNDDDEALGTGLKEFQSFYKLSVSFRFYTFLNHN